jgi:cytidine deaminase
MAALSTSRRSALVRAARSARRRAYAPYSSFRVGAALLTTSGTIVTGCNVENSSYGLTVCAERSALFTAVSKGFRSFTSIAISTDAGVPIPPCGACRQVLAEFAPELLVILDAGSGRPVGIPLSALLPLAFQPSHLRKKKKR